MKALRSFRSGKAEHICLPSNNLQATLDTLNVLGAKILIQKDDVAFVQFAGQIFELKRVQHVDIPDVKDCHIGISFTTIELFNGAVEGLRKLPQLYSLTNHTTATLAYEIFRLPGGVGLQIIWRDKSLTQ